MSYVCIQSEPSLWTVGCYSPDDTWHPESDHGSRGEAMRRVAWLNGGGGPEPGAEEPKASNDIPTFYGDAVSWLGLADRWRDGESPLSAALIAQGYALLAIAEAINKMTGRGIES